MYDPTQPPPGPPGYPQPGPPPPGYLPPPAPQQQQSTAAGIFQPVITLPRKTALIILAATIFVSGGVGAAAGSAPAEEPVAAPRATVTVTVRAKPAPVKAAASPTVRKPTTAKLPSLVGKNGAIARNTLEKLGVTNVEHSSADPDATVVVMLANWRVVKQEPKAGARVRTGEEGTLIVLTMKKIA